MASIRKPRPWIMSAPSCQRGSDFTANAYTTAAAPQTHCFPKGNILSLLYRSFVYNRQYGMVRPRIFQGRITKIWRLDFAGTDTLNR